MLAVEDEDIVEMSCLAYGSQRNGRDTVVECLAGWP